MMNKTPLLSICIPTLNRAEALKQNLESLLPQFIKHQNVVELIVSNNASNDNTDEVIDELKVIFNVDFEYVVQEKRIEKGDLHFRKVVEMAKGKYVHLLGDDDILSPNFYDVAIEILNNDYGLIFFNRLAGDAYCDNNKVYDPKYSNLIEILESGEFAKKMLSVCGFMSAIIFRRDCWIKGEDFAKDNYYGYQWLARIYAGAIMLDTKSVYYYMPMLLMRAPVRTWGKLWMQYWIVGLSSIFKDLDVLAPGIYGLWMEKVHDKKKHYFIDGLFLAITSDQMHYKRLKPEFWPFLNQRQKIAYTLFLHLKPAIVFNYCYRGFKKIWRTIVS